MGSAGPVGAELRCAAVPPPATFHLLDRSAAAPVPGPRSTGAAGAGAGAGTGGSTASAVKTVLARLPEREWLALPSFLARFRLRPRSLEPLELERPRLFRRLRDREDRPRLPRCGEASPASTAALSLLAEAAADASAASAVGECRSPAHGRLRLREALPPGDAPRSPAGVK